MIKKLLKEGVFWGVVLWLIGYVLGIILFMVVPANLIGWVIAPIGTLITTWVLFKKIKSDSLSYYLQIAVIWLLLAVVLDYLLLVRMFNPVDGYYKPSVYFYYSATFVLPILVGWYKTKKSE